jgi:hypothetical protein
VWLPLLLKYSIYFLSNSKHKHIVYLQVRGVLDENGILTPEQMGYDKPELFIPNAEWWWEHSWYKEYGYDKKPGYHF